MPLPRLDTPGRRILALSLFVNLVTVAVIGGHALWHHGPPPDPARLLAHIADSLPDSDGRILHLALKSEAATLDAPAFDPRAAMIRIRAALAADPFDATALAAAVAKAQGDREAVEQALLRATTTAATAMSPDGRHRLADRLPCPPH